jgi:hypothetical protein
VLLLLLRIDDPKHPSGNNTIFLLTKNHFKALNLIHRGSKRTCKNLMRFILSEKHIKADKISHYMRFFHHIYAAFLSPTN